MGWATLPPGTGSGCGLIDSFVAGPGGFWLSRGISPKPPTYSVARLAVSVRGPKKPVRSGKTATFKAVVRNAGDQPAEGVRLCVKAPQAKRRCVAAGRLAARQAATATFRIRAPNVTRRKRFAVRGSLHRDRKRRDDGQGVAETDRQAEAQVALDRCRRKVYGPQRKCAKFWWFREEQL
ncbi:MAG: hypothetical protein WKF94_12165 [Solirubrobacteraceae bacterium]